MQGPLDGHAVAIINSTGEQHLCDLTAVVCLSVFMWLGWGAAAFDLCLRLPVSAEYNRGSTCLHGTEDCMLQPARRVDTQVIAKSTIGCSCATTSSADSRIRCSTPFPCTGCPGRSPGIVPSHAGSQLFVYHPVVSVSGVGGTYMMVMLHTCCG